MAKRLTAGITKKTRGAQLICGKKILPNSDHADTFAQIANRTKETSDTPIAGRKAANTFCSKNTHRILTGANSKPSRVPLSFSPTKLSIPDCAGCHQGDHQEERRHKVIKHCISYFLLISLK